MAEWLECSHSHLSPEFEFHHVLQRRSQCAEHLGSDFCKCKNAQSSRSTKKINQEISMWLKSWFLILKKVISIQVPNSVQNGGGTEVTTFRGIQWKSEIKYRLYLIWIKCLHHVSSFFTYLKCLPFPALDPIGPFNWILGAYNQGDSSGQHQTLPNLCRHLKLWMN